MIDLYYADGRSMTRSTCGCGATVLDDSWQRHKLYCKGNPVREIPKEIECVINARVVMFPIMALVMITKMATMGDVSIATMTRCVIQVKDTPLILRLGCVILGLK